MKLIFATVSLVFLLLLMFNSFSDVNSKNKNLRLFSNIFGLSGNNKCVARVDSGYNSTGLCFNEIECLIR